MSPIAIALDGLLAALLVLALIVGVRLNKRLKFLRESQAGFAQAVLELNQAAARADAGLASLRAASEEAHDSLLARIETARSLSTKLERLNAQAERALQPAPPPPAFAAPSPEPSARRSLDAFAALLSQRGEPAPPPAQPAASRAAPESRRRLPAVEDDLFEGDPDARGPGDRGLDLGPLKSPAAADGRRTTSKGDRR